MHIVTKNCAELATAWRRIGRTRGNQSLTLRKYNSTPPVWFLDVSQASLWSSTLKHLLSQPTFQKGLSWNNLTSCHALLRKADYGKHGSVLCLMKEMKENDAAIIEVAEDASTSGQFYDYLEEFCRHLTASSGKRRDIVKTALDR
jgi:hypothetical protein